jgi:hypothetical protein
MMVWREVSNLLMTPERIELEQRNSATAGTSFDNLQALRSQRTKLEHTVERLIDSYTEGLIEKDQFTSRMARTKNRIAGLDARINADSGDVDQREQLQRTTNRLRELARAFGPELASADWQRKQEIMRTLVQRIEIDTEVIKIIFRLTENTRGKSTTLHFSFEIEDAEHLHSIGRDRIFFVDYADVAKAKGFNQSLNDFVVRNRSVGSGCLGNGDLRQLCSPRDRR